jgi:hypothetical protein
MLITFTGDNIMVSTATDKPRVRNCRTTILMTDEEARQWEEYVRSQAEPGERPNASRVFRGMLREKGVFGAPERNPKKSAHGG